MENTKTLVSDDKCETIASLAQQQPSMRDAGRSHLIWTAKHVRDLYEEELRKHRELIPYVKHAERCPTFAHWLQTCSCGLQEKLDALTK